jgi:hypothetical protein
MSSAENKSLEDWVREWANNNRERAHRWCAELKQNDIDDIQALEERAQSSRWQSTLDKLSDGLVVKLEKWYEGKYQSKFLMIMG